MSHIKSYLTLVFLSANFGFLFSQPKEAYPIQHKDSLIHQKFPVDSKTEAEDAVENIVKYTGLIQNFQIVENRSISTAIAYNKKKIRYIAYNPQFMLRVKDRTKSDWGAVSVLAHEIGHHLAGHTLIKKNRNPQEELDADRFSGFILYKMGASLEEAKSVINLVELNSNSKTHPTKTARLIAITIGWLDANKLEEGFSSSDTTSRNISALLSSDSLKQALQNPSEKKVPYVYKCLIYADKNYYFVDEKNQVVSIDDYGQAYVVGYKVKSQDPSFNWIFSVQSLTYGVDSRGKMWNKTYAGDMFVVGKVYNIKR
ncbi:MAG: hypothetical protein HY840_15540 [Bacteroidetes bacterium]|nr:hypothetical protein [Bacteroidota bacterium]